MDLAKTATREPLAGDYVATVTKTRRFGTVYMIISSRKVKRRDPKACPRFNLTVQREPVPELPAGVNPEEVWFLHWYKREKRKRPNA